MPSFLFTANPDDEYVDQEVKNLEYTNIKDSGAAEVDFAAKELEETEDPPQINNKKENDNKNSHGEKNSTTGNAHNPIPPQAHKAENRETRTGILQNDFVFICKFLTYTCMAKIILFFLLHISTVLYTCKAMDHLRKYYTMSCK